MSERSVYISVGELPTDDRTLRQAKAVAAYKHPGLKVLKASWNHPGDKSHGVTVVLDNPHTV